MEARHIHPPEPDLLPVEEAQARILEHFAPLPPEEVPLLSAVGQVLAEAVRAPFAVPPWDNSAMDGYAVRAEDIAGASPERPVFLRVVDQVPAGRMPGRAVGRGEAVRLMTGAPLPPGADAVVPFEETDEVERLRRGEPLGVVAVRRALPAGANVRRAGEDVAPGAEVLPAGTPLRPAVVGVLAELGLDRVRVFRRPRVAVLSTGDELVPPGQPRQPGQIYDANTYALASAVQEAGGVPLVLDLAPDRLEVLQDRLRSALQADLILTSAGVSKGDYDIVKTALETWGEMRFWSVRLKPGKPLAFGLMRGEGGRRVPLLGLPGNPVSALVTFELMARPAIRRMLGHRRLFRPTVPAVLEGGAIRNHDGRRVYARVRLAWRGGRWTARLVGPQGSHILTGMARANGLAICPEDRPEVGPGEVVQVLPLDWPEEEVVEG